MNELFFKICHQVKNHYRNCFYVKQLICCGVLKFNSVTFLTFDTSELSVKCNLNVFG